MTTQELKTLIRSEIQREQFRSTAAGIDVDRCLVSPRKEVFRSAGSRDEALELWVVLEEHPATHRGYVVVYDEEGDAFGLAMVGDRGHKYLRSCGSFLEAASAI